MPALLEAKANLRRVMRATRDALGPAARRAATAQACQRLLALPEVQAARSLAVFSAIRGELDLAPLISDRRAAGAQILYPRVVAGLSPRLRFHVVLQPGQLVPGAYGIPEPPAEAPEVPAEAIEVVLVPGLAFDGAGRRLGYGGGYYDEVAAQVRAQGAGRGFLLGVGFDFQLIDSCPADDRDVAIDCVVTDARVVRRAENPEAPSR